MSTVRHHYSKSPKRRVGTIVNYLLAIVILVAAVVAVLYLK